ncbi:uncharacterized protein LOC134102847 [Sardina pilchardus]|uniref:uncharacterized protein LOC134102847 n=1 Tax=Sardina pilchardus TaxID=27697 RepID=UPI002E0EE94B
MDYIYYTSFLLIAGAVGQMRYSVKGLDVHLSPVSEQVPPGSNITLNCSFPTVNAQWIKWQFIHFNNTDLIQLPRPGHEHRIDQKMEKYSSTLTVINAHENDTGWYLCEVHQHIPKLLQWQSNRSTIIVGNSSIPRYMMGVGVGVWIWVGAGAGTTVVIVLILFWILWRRRRYKERENPVYENTNPKLQRVGPKQPSPRPCVQTDQSKRILTASTTPKPARACESKSRTKP